MGPQTRSIEEARVLGVAPRGGGYRFGRNSARGSASVSISASVSVSVSVGTIALTTGFVHSIDGLRPPLANDDDAYNGDGDRSNH